MRQANAVTLAALLVIATAGDAAAFPTGNQFDMDPLKSDGAGGIAFDGSPRWTHHDCAACHTDPPGIIGLSLESDHPELFTDGWKASQQYHLRVVLDREWAGIQYQKNGDMCGGAVTPYVPCNDNGFALEVDDDVGQPTGKFVPVVNNACAVAGAMVPPDVDARVLTDGTAVTHNGAHHAQSAWDFCWTAPASGAGLLTAYLATVDGNGGDGTANFPADTVGDDVAVGAVPFQELGGAPPPPQTGGCQTGGDAGAGMIIAVALLALRRRRFAAVVALVALAGCTHVRPRERETLAKRNMTFAPDPIEDELDLHMQEAREGSAGGYGSSGGGCGCN